MGYVLVINPGSTSSKIALFKDGGLINEKSIRYTNEELSIYESIFDQKDFRKPRIDDFLAENGITKNDLIAVVGRGGLMKAVEGGTYIVNDTMVKDLSEGKYGMHASNLGAVLAKEVADEIGIKAYIVDPVIIDEMQDIARISGLKGLERRSVFHALNQKSVARKVAAQKNKQYDEVNLIVAHLGGGISIGAHEKGKVIDVINGIDGEGPYSPERTGTLPLIDFAQLIINEKLNIEQVKKILAGHGSIQSYLNDIDMINVENRALAGEAEYKKYLDGMCYQIAKGIGEMSVVLEGNVDYIVLTGGISYSEYVAQFVKEHVQFISEVVVMPGEEEMRALYEGTKRVLDGIEAAKIY